MLARFNLITALLASPIAVLAMPYADGSASDAQLSERSSSGIGDMSDVCRSQWGPDYKAYTDGLKCTDWICLGPNNDRRDINMDLYCYQEHGVDASSSCVGGRYHWKCKW
ncbi:hypothetical protein F4778DRAFT_87473 [Xylariomycetidae sp. FL2044]|nr:hypothetical protein F4778DRAFT_87473 [Xylariomycetidae sp. FL2044]